MAKRHLRPSLAEARRPSANQAPVFSALIFFLNLSLMFVTPLQMPGAFLPAAASFCSRQELMFSFLYLFNDRIHFDGNPH